MRPHLFSSWLPVVLIIFQLPLSPVVPSVCAQKELHVGIYQEREDPPWEYMAPWAFPGLLVPIASNGRGGFSWRLSPAMQSVAISHDGHVWVFRPKPGMQFPQGQALLVSDIEYSLQNCLSKTLDAGHRQGEPRSVIVRDQSKPASWTEFAVEFQNHKLLQGDRQPSQSMHESNARFLAGCPLFASTVEIWREENPEFHISPVLFGSYLIEPPPRRNEIPLRKSFIYTQVDSVEPDTTSLQTYAKFRDGLRDLRRGRLDLLIAPSEVIQEEWQEEDYIHRKVCMHAAYGREYEFLIREGVSEPCVSSKRIHVTTQARPQ